MKDRKFGIVRIILIAILSVVALLAIAGLVACSSSETPENESYLQAPVYQGMTIFSANQSLSATGNELVPYAANVSGDIAGKEASIGSEKPFGDGSATIEQQIEQEFKVTGAGQDIYYADLNEDILITVKFSNPDDYQILSFKINGNTYVDYMFQDGSDMENIIIKLNVGDIAGFNEYTISEIKYIDGIEIKDVLLNGDTSVKCGVRGDEDVRVTVSNESVTLDTISLSAKIVDVYSLVKESGGFIKAVLYDGTDLLEIIDLEVGNNEIEFTNLYPNTLYQYAIVAVYDDLSGNGAGISYLYKKSVYTEALVLFKDVEVTKTSVSFAFEWYPGYDDSYLHTKFTLEDGSSRLTSIDPTTEITGLLSDHEYTLNVAYTGLYGETEAIRLTFTTLAMEMPEVEIEITETTKASISYIVTISDEDGVGEDASVVVYRGEEVVYEVTDVSSGAEQKLDNLLSGDEYMIVVSYSYNLNDGEGIQTMEVSETISTEAKSLPKVSISSLTSTKDQISYELTVTDEDDAGEISSVELFLDEELVGSCSESTGTFTNLLSGFEYTLNVVYAYDLNDGAGERTFSVSQSVATRAMQMPTVEISCVDVSTDELTFSVAYTDEDNIGTMTSIQLLAGDSLVSDTGTYTGEMTYSNLSSYTLYTLVVSFSYDLNDGIGTRYGTEELSAHTDPLLEFNSINIINSEPIIDGVEIRFAISMFNPDGVEFTFVVINGTKYAVSSSSSSENIYVNIENYGQYEGGDTNFVLSLVTGFIDGTEYSIGVSENNIATTFINGALYADRFTIVAINDGVEEERLYRFQSENLYYKIEFTNGTGYEIDGVTIGDVTYSGNDFYVTEDRQAVYVAMPADSGTGWCTDTFSGASYHNDNVERDKAFDLSFSYVLLSTTSDEIVEITSAEQFMEDMTGWKYYKLMCDIDLSGCGTWVNVGNSLQGVFDGNGKIISGAIGATTRSDMDLYLGLFDNVEGVVINLEVCDMVYSMTLRSTTGKTYDVYAGGLAATSDQMIVVDCRITSSVHVVNETGGTVYIGALSGKGSKKTNLYYVLSDIAGDVTSDKYASYGFLGNVYIGSLDILDSECDCSLTISVSGSENYIQIDSFVFSVDKDGYTLVEYLGTEKSVTLPSSVDGNPYDIGDRAFYSNKYIEEVMIPECVTSIGDYAFYNCSSLKSISIPDSVTNIGNRAFCDCSSVTNLTIGEGVYTIGDYAFAGCTLLEEIHYNAINAKNQIFCNYIFSRAGQNGDGITLTIGSNVTSIPQYIFSPDSTYLGYDYYANITRVIFEKGCQCISIGYRAFDLCISIVEVYYSGMPEDWNAISIGNDNSYLSHAARYYYSETEPDYTDGYDYWHYVDGEIVIWNKED